jgi:hypothetical protein
LEKEDEINLGVINCYNVAFNGNGKIAVVVCSPSQFVILEVGRNVTYPD